MLTEEAVNVGRRCYASWKGARFSKIAGDKKGARIWGAAWRINPISSLDAGGIEVKEKEGEKYWFVPKWE